MKKGVYADVVSATAPIGYYAMNGVEKKFIPSNAVLITLSISAPTAFWAQVKTHGSIATNAFSARAVPFATYKDYVLENLFLGDFRKRKQKGMGGELMLAQDVRERALEIAETAMSAMLGAAIGLEALGCAKEDVNRFISPFGYTPALATGTLESWDNLVALRDDPIKVQPSFYDLAAAIKRAIEGCAIQDSFMHYPFLDEFSMMGGKEVNFGFTDEQRSLLAFPSEVNDTFLARMFYEAGRAARWTFGGEERPTTTVSDVVQRGIRAARDWEMSCFEHVAFFNQREIGHVGSNHGEEHPAGKFGPKWTQLRRFLRRSIKSCGLRPAILS